MKRKYLLITLFLFILIHLAVKGYAQNYDLVDYYFDGTPTYGIRINTQIPFQNGGSMPTIRIEGYDYGHAQPIGLDLVWYVYKDNFVDAAVSSWGAYTPPIYLSDENGFISIFINDKSYFERFHVSAYAKGLGDEDTTSFSGWTITDDSLGGSNQLLVPYKNSFAGIVSVSGNLGIGTTNPLGKLTVAGINSYNDIQFTGNSSTGVGFSVQNTQSGGHKFDLFSGGSGNSAGSGSFSLYDETAGSYRFVIKSSGNILIGKTSQSNSSYKLDVNGSVRADKLVVNSTGADFVFDPGYRLPSIDSLNSYIKIHHHLPGVSSAEHMLTEGNDLGITQIKVLQNEEEMALYIISIDKKQKVLEAKLIRLASENKRLNTRISELSKQINKQKEKDK